MIIDSEIFLIENFYKFNKKYQFIEDLWMSYYAINKLNYILYNGTEIADLVTSNDTSNDINAQWKKLKSEMDEFLISLRNDGEWNV